MLACIKRNMKGLTAKVSGGEAVRLTAELDPKAKRERPALKKGGSMPFCVELDNLKDTDAPIHQPAAMLVAAD